MTLPARHLGLTIYFLNVSHISALLAFPSSGIPKFSFLGFCLLTGLFTSYLPLLFSIFLAAASRGSTSCLHLQCLPLVLLPSRLIWGPCYLPSLVSFPLCLLLQKELPQGLTHAILLPGPPFLPHLISYLDNPYSPFKASSMSPPPGKLFELHPA